MTKPFDRRHFLKVSMVGGSLVAVLPLAGCAENKSQTVSVSSEGVQFGWFVKINPDNSIVIGAPNMDMGQGTFTSMPMMVAEELDADWNNTSVELMPVALQKVEEGQEEISGVNDGYIYNGYTYAHAYQGAGGSGSVKRNYIYLREAGAAVRSRLIRAAAAQLETSVSTLRTENSYVIHDASNRRVPYSSLIDDAAALEDDPEVQLKDPKDFKIIGAAIGGKGVKSIVTGEPVFGIDQEIPDMVHAVVARSPFFKAEALSFDDSAARAVPGVIDVIQIPRLWRDFSDPEIFTVHGGVAVIAETVWAAIKARRLLEIEWDQGVYANESSTSNEAMYLRYLNGEEQEDRELRNDGDVETALSEADRTFEATYSIKAWAHVCMEPHSAIADMRPDVLKVWAAHQFPERISFSAAEIADCDPRDITVENARMGGGFGRKYATDYTSEAIWLSHHLQRPVKVTWTREDDVRHDAFNPPGMTKLRAGVDSNGEITAWDQMVAQHSVQIHVFPAGFVDNFRGRQYRPETGMWFGAWRSPGHNVMAFLIQSFLDEIAVATEQDPLAFRLGMMEPGKRIPYEGWGADFYDSGREAAVLKIAAENADWPGRGALPPGQGRGIASHFTFGSYCAHVVDVHVEDGELEIRRIVTAVDCGRVVNRLGVEAQMEGGAIDGISAALRQAVHIEGGQVVEQNFDAYQMLRINEAPKHIDVHIVDSTEPPTGTGEISLPPIIPALTNAIFHATGKRIRDLPIADQLRV